MTHYKKILASLILCVTVVAAPGALADETGPREKTKPLTIGLIPERNIFKQLERYGPLAEFLSNKIGIQIKLKVLTRYGNIIENFVSAGMDAAFFGSFTYALARAKLGVIALARPQTADGRSTYHGLIFVRRDSGIHSVGDMRGKSFVFVDRATTAGYLLPLAFFKEIGVEDYRKFFKETYFAGTHQGAIYDVLNKKADIGAAKNTMFFSLARRDRRIRNELVVLKRSPDVPENGLAVRKDLDASVSRRLKEALVNMHNDPEGRKVLEKFGAKMFIETSDHDYANVYLYAKEIGLDLTTYNYINE